MRHLLTAAVALAVGGFVATTAAHADMLYYQGGPVVNGSMCQVTTDGDNRYGYWMPCPASATVKHVRHTHMAKRTKKMKS